MKIIGKAEQKKIDLQIESLQKQVAELDTQLAAVKAEHKKLETSAVKAQAESVQAQAEVAKAKAEVSKALAEAAKASADVAKAEKEGNAATTAVQAKLDAAIKQFTEASQENELLLSQLMQVQEELEKNFLEKKQLESAIAKAQSDAESQSEAQQKITQQAQADVAKLSAELTVAKVELDKVQQGLAQAAQNIANEQKAKQAVEAALAEIKAKTPAELKAVTDKYQQQAQAAQVLEQELAKHKSELEQLKKEAAQQADKLKDTTQENELLLSQLMQVQEELEKIFLDKKQLESAVAKAQSDAKSQTEAQQKITQQSQAEVAKLSTELASSKTELAKVKQGLAQAAQNMANEQKAKQVAEATLAELKAKTPAELKAVTDKYEQQAQAAQALEAELVKHKSELEQARQAAANAKAETSKTQQAKLELDTLQARMLSELEQIKKESAQQANQQATKLKDTAQENELLLTQLMQVQEELESYYLDKTKFEKLYQDIQARWARLEKRYPNYVDFSGVELVAFDNLSDVPSITWRVKDYAQGGVAFEEILFQTVLQDGQPGIGLVTDAKATAAENSALVPKLLKPQSKQLERYLRMGQTEFRQLIAATTIVTQLESSGWRGVDLPKDFDLGFWRESLKLLPTQLQALPVLLRYDAVKLKRELVNPDYEHLWLEFKGLGLGARAWPKFELRLGAAMVQRDGFSQFPKFEIPLIDGKTKPFDSWYAESQDDSGAKLELRFSLEKQVFDTSVWAKLEDADKALLLRLIYAMPDVLQRLEEEHAAIQRPWATWVSFAKAAMQVIEATRATGKPKEQPAPNAQAKVLPASTSSSPTQLPAPAKKASAKPVAKKTPAAAKKAAPAKKAPPKNVAAAKPAAAEKNVAIKEAVAPKPVTQKATTAKPITVAKKTTVVEKVAAAKRPARKK